MEKIVSGPVTDNKEQAAGQAPVFMSDNSISARMSIDGCKGVSVLSLAVVGIYAAIKLVDKLCGASVVINADNHKVEG